MTRKPAWASVDTQRVFTQFTAWFEAKPWMRRIGSPRPVSGFTSI
jgi:hypothetical protein